MKFLLLGICLFSISTFAIWEEGAQTPINGLHNPYQLPENKFQSEIRSGRLHALNYPVQTTGLLVPYYPLKEILDSTSDNPVKLLLLNFMKGLARIRSFDEMNQWLGLHKYPDTEGEGAYFIPKKQGLIEQRMGFTLIERNGALGFTHACAACHSNNLFGKKIMGLTNRFPRANDYFVKGKKAFSFLSVAHFKMATGATPAEIDLLRQTKTNLLSVEARTPSAYGLDTSLAHVAISLSRRAQDPFATKNTQDSHYPRNEILRTFIADSKPGVWWNVKYKNKWLLDGSVVSGNPVLTNILWNEIGRGSDLYELDDWLTNNQQIIEELTTAVFSTEAPRISDFFPERYFDLPSARRGENLFNQSCKKCHGTYQKVWSIPSSASLPWQDQIKNLSVEYPADTLVRDVGTDPQRWQGMKSLEQLNHLAISQKYGVLIKSQKGYVPPPLEGIWARWPYFHNNSIPNLCALMTPPELRPKKYYSGEANNTSTDFDFDCNGYPLGTKTPSVWKKKQFLFNTQNPGLSNLGHYQKIFLSETGQEKFSAQDKKDLIHYLQTL